MFLSRCMPIGLAFLVLSLVSQSVAAKQSASPSTETPIAYLVVIFMENTSFDASFGTYPNALNPPGSPAFAAKPGTGSVNGLTETLLLFNPNTSNPFRIGRLDSYTCDQNHKYTEELNARNGGLMNQFVQFGAEGPGTPPQFCHQNADNDWDTDMGYFDGNTVTALWNYAQRFAMSDNNFATMAGESARGAQNLVRGDATGALCVPATKGSKAGNIFVPNMGVLPPCNGPVDSNAQPPPSDPNGLTGVLGDDLDPYYDICSKSEETTAFTGRNIGNLLNDAGITWGWFQGGFEDCSRTSNVDVWLAAKAQAGEPVAPPTPLTDYVPHYNPFQYFQSTSNPMHLPPDSVATIGHTDKANHLYGLRWFFEAAESGNLPTVSYLKPIATQTGHPGHSDPLDQQFFLVETLNRLQQLKEWKQMAVIVAWDDSDGWYDHVMGPVINTSNTMNDDGLCGAETQGAGTRCGYGPRLPLLVISPYAKGNYVSHQLTDQTSILRFIEDNWLGGERISATSFDNMAGSLMDLFDFSAPKNSGRFILDPFTGQPKGQNGK